VLPPVGAGSRLTKRDAVIAQPTKAGGIMNLFARFVSAAFLVLGVLSFGIAAEAQTSTTGVVLGTVADSSGAAVLDASVILRNTATNNQVTQTTNNAGRKA
jgi:hypothetical protein